jgi:hypothetical protein
MSQKNVGKILGFVWFVVVFVVPFIFIGVLGWEKIFFRVFTVFLMTATGIVFLFYGGLMRYPGVNDVGNYPKERQREITQKRKVLGPFVRILLLGLSVSIAWGFLDFFKDVALILTGKDACEEVTGKITTDETLWGTAPFYQWVQLNGDSNNNGHAYFYNFYNRFPIGSQFEFKILKNSKFIVDDKSLNP